MVWAGRRGDFAFGDLGAVWRTRIPTTLLLAFLVWIFAGCTNGVPSVKPECAPPSSTSSESDTRRGSTTIDSLGLSLALPPSFRQCEDPELAFLAKSVSPPAVLSIAHDSPSVINHVPEAQEIVAPANIEGVDAVTVTDAVVEGLPAGVSARQLFVANGDRSFSVILSAPESDLAALWKEFIGSVRVEAD